jgi:hypothetical protein
MKKILLTIGLIAATSAAFAQGMISFTPGTYSVSTNGTQYSPLFGGGATGHGAIATTAGGTGNIGTYYYELLIQHWTGTTPTDLNVWDGTWKDSGLYDTNSSVAGRILAGPSSLQVGSLVGWNAFANGGNTFPNGTNNIILVGWSASLGTSWLQVSNACVAAAANPNHYFTTAGFFGESALGYINPSSGTVGTGIAVMVAGLNAGGLPITTVGGMVLYEVPVPEPATFALVGLGGLSLLLFRRRK